VWNIPPPTEYSKDVQSGSHEAVIGQESYTTLPLTAAMLLDPFDNFDPLVMVLCRRMPSPGGIPKAGPPRADFRFAATHLSSPAHALFRVFHVSSTPFKTDSKMAAMKKVVIRRMKKMAMNHIWPRESFPMSCSLGMAKNA
jgi:hypothetical protein